MSAPICRVKEMKHSREDSTFETVVAAAESLPSMDVILWLKNFRGCRRKKILSFRRC